MRTPSSLHVFSLAGVPVLVHWTVLLALPVAWAATQGVARAGAACMAFLVLMLAHEVGHAVVARRFGTRVFLIQLCLIHGRCVFEVPRSSSAAIAISWGGVAAQAVLFTAAVLAAKFVRSDSGGLPAPASAALAVFIPINLLVLFVNLLPIPPLDGATAWRVVPAAAKALWAHVRGRNARRRRTLEIVSSELNRIASARRKDSGES